MNDPMNRLALFGTGFIADNYIRHWCDSHPSDTVRVFYNRHKSTHADIKQIGWNETGFLDTLAEFRPTYLLCLQGNSYVTDNASIKNAFEKNLLKIAELLESIEQSTLKKSLKKILIVGSAGEYGKNRETPLKEQDGLFPTSLYGLSKTLLHHTSQYYCRRGLPLIYIRQFNTVGIGQQEKFVLPSFTKQIVQIEKGIREKSISVGDLKQERDFLDIRDSNTAYDRLFESGQPGEVYNVASGHYISINFLLNKIIELSDLQADEISITYDSDKINSKENLSQRLCADIGKLKALGFEPKYDITSTIRTMLEYWRQHV